jgi:hypothetical protein
MKDILNHVNEKLKKHNTQLDNNAVLTEYFQVKKAWDNAVKLIKQPIKFLIIGEATVSFDNYFYNEKSDTTPFLNPSYFNCKTKSELIQLFNKNGILVFDLYPLPLSTFIYDNLKFDCTELVYKSALEKYYNTAKTIINDDTKIILRYSKLYSIKKNKKGKEKIEKRNEWTIFMDHINKKEDDFQNISSGNQGSSKDKIKKIFTELIP